MFPLTPRQGSIRRLALNQGQGGAFGNSVVDERVETLPSVHAGNDGSHVIVLKRQVAAVPAVPLYGVRRWGSREWREGKEKSMIGGNERKLNSRRC